MTVSLPFFLPLVAILVVFVACVPLLREAARLTLSAPAFLVPAAITGTATGILVDVAGSREVADNPLGLVGYDFASHPASWLAFALTALAIAGQIGLLEAQARGQRPDGAAFVAGLRTHGGTLLLGKLTLGACLWLVSQLIPPRGAVAIVYLLPNVWFAPLAGASSLHPRNPVGALRATIRTASRDFAAVGRLVLGLACAWITLCWLQGPLGRDDSATLIAGASSLSYGVFPPLWSFAAAPVDFLVLVLACLAGATSLTAHWLGVMRGYGTSVQTTASRGTSA
jgi:hypothetical protein